MVELVWSRQLKIANSILYWEDNRIIRDEQLRL